MIRVFLAACLYVLGNALLPLSLSAANEYPRYDLAVSVAPAQGRLWGEAVIAAGATGGIVSFDALTVVAAHKNGRAITEKAVGDGQIDLSAGETLVIRYERWFPPPNRPPAPGHDRPASDNHVSDDGVVLFDGWYPEVSARTHFRLNVELPDPFVAVSEADTVVREKIPSGTRTRFSFSDPLESIHLVADRYQVTARTVDGIDVVGYFSEENRDLADGYLTAVEHYLRMYAEMLGPFPYKRFAVVETILPAGLSMPTFTLLGRAVVKLPFILKTSLGHEVLHQWFGNAVPVDTAGGNWSEGLTTYLADHLYQERQGSGGRYRKQLMVDYQSYVTPGNASPLKDFHGRADRVSRAIGYGKGAMVFHMLEQEVGGAAFNEALQVIVASRRTRPTGWKDLQAAAEMTSGKNLGSFFSQWLDRADLPRIGIEDPRFFFQDGQSRISLDIVQTVTAPTAPYALKLKVEILTYNEPIIKIISTSEYRRNIVWDIPESVTGIVIDPDYDVLRVLADEEVPPVWSRVMGAGSGLLVVSENDRQRFNGLITVMAGLGFAAVADTDVTEKQIHDSTLVLAGKNRVYRRLFGDDTGQAPMADHAGFSLEVRPHPLKRTAVVAVADSSDPAETDAAAFKLSHYGNYSALAFSDGKNIRKTVPEQQWGIVADLIHTVSGIVPTTMLSLNEIIDNIQDEPVIYIGESHDRYEDHRVQLEVIRRLQAAGHRLAIGMEMFQRPYQPEIDDYLSGKINERQFLKSTEYFRRWRFDYRLYRDIVNFAKVNRIPVVALNIEGEINRKVARGGLDALTPEERAKVPPDMDMSDIDYRERLRKIFDQHQHGNLGEGSFYHFYQAQIVWDETMAHAVSAFMTRHPDRRMIVLAGGGHLAYGAGIPARVTRLTGKKGIILMNAGSDDLLKPGIADFLLVPEPLSLPEPPKLGILIEGAGPGVTVKEVADDGPADVAGIESGDIITVIDGLEIESVEDVRIALFDRESGDRLPVEIVRTSFLFGDEPISVEVVIP